MQRLFSILLLVLIGYSTVSPIALASAGLDQPACCRKGGKHHCAVGRQTAAPLSTDGEALSISAKCQFSPVSALSDLRNFGDTPTLDHMDSMLLYAESTGAPQTEARFRVALTRGWQKRGPPAFLLK